jgi:hypothetical protein
VVIGSASWSALKATRNPAPAWRRALAFGAMGGVTLTAMEFLLLPPGLSLVELSEIVLHVLPQWVVTGIGIAVIAMAAVDRVRARTLALVLVVYAVAMSSLFAILRQLARMLALPTGGSIFAGGAPMLPTFFYDLWVILFFGSLFLAACSLGIRAERTRNLLARAEIGRSRAAMLLDAAQLSALQCQVDPAFLLRVMTEVEHRFAHDHEVADRLLDRLVAFLRRAMPGVRSGASTLEDEVGLVIAYGAVWRELDPQRARWSVRIDGTLPKLPFPPLLLLPVVDHWAAALAAGTQGGFSVRCDHTAVVLALSGPLETAGDWLPPALAYRLGVGLRTACGDAWHLAVSDSTRDESPALSLTLPHTPTIASHPDMEVVHERS